eukprot:g1425.t1
MRGSLLLFKTSASSAGRAREVASVETNSRKKAVTLMEVVDDVVVVLCVDIGRLSAFTRGDLRHIPNVGLEQHRRSNILAVNFDMTPPRLCVGERRRLTLYECLARSFKVIRTVDLPHTPKSMEWSSSTISIGFNDEYAFYDTKSGRLSTVPGLLDADTKPLLKVFDDQVLVVGKDNMGVFVDFNGVPLPRNPLIWKDAPSAVGYCRPYVVSMFKSRVEVHRFPDKSAAPILAQSVPVPDAGRLVSISDDSIVLVAGTRHLKRLMQTKASTIIENLLRDVRIDEAMQLLKDTTSAIDMPAALIRFHKNAAVALILARRYEKVDDHWAKSGGSPDELLMLVPEVVPVRELRVVMEKTTPSPLRNLAESAAVAKRKTDTTDRHALYKCVSSVLANVRRKRNEGKGTSSSAFSRGALDTALLRLFLRLSDTGAMETLARSKNWVDVEAVDEELRRLSHFHILALLNVNAGHYEKGLCIWRQLGNGTLRERAVGGDKTWRDGVESTVDFLSSDTVASSDFVQLVLKFSNWVLLRSPLQALRIFLVPRIPAIPLKSACDCLEQVDAALAEQRRRAFASERTPQSHVPPMLLQRFLEHVLGVAIPNSAAVKDDLKRKIFRSPSSNPTKERLYADLNSGDVRAYSTRLALEYLKGIEYAATRCDVGGTASGFSVKVARDKLNYFLDSDDLSVNAVAILRNLDDAKSLNRELVKSKARVLGILGRHEDALELLLRQRSIDVAETYCLDYAARILRCRNASLCEDAERRDADPDAAMLALLAMLLRPSTSCASPLPKSVSAYQGHAMRLLMKHARPRSPGWEGLNPLKVIDIIPDSLPLASLMPYFALSVPALRHRLRHSQVTKHLSKFNTQVLLREKVLRAQNRRVVIDRDSRCCVSGEPIDENMVFAVYPNGRISLYHNVHGKDLSVDPITGEAFKGSGSLPLWYPDRKRALGEGRCE